MTHLSFSALPSVAYRLKAPLWGACQLAVLGGLGLVLPDIADAAGLPLMNSAPAGGGTNYSLSLQMLLFLTSLTFIPTVLLMMTSFTRIVIVLSLLRQALGTMQSPPNQVIVGLSLFLTLFIMGPVLDKVYAEAWMPFSEDKINYMQALDKGSQPMKEFMMQQTRDKDLQFFIEISRSEKPKIGAEITININSAFCTILMTSSGVMLPLLTDVKTLHKRTHQQRPPIHQHKQHQLKRQRNNHR